LMFYIIINIYYYYYYYYNYYYYYYYYYYYHHYHYHRRHHCGWRVGTTIVLNNQSARQTRYYNARPEYYYNIYNGRV